MKAQFNLQSCEIETDNDISRFIDQFDSESEVEACLYSQTGASISLFKSGEYMFLMFLPKDDSVGFVSSSSSKDSHLLPFKLANGQEDKYSACWCVGDEWALKALTYFYYNDGEQSPYIIWQRP